MSSLKSNQVSRVTNCRWIKQDKAAWPSGLRRQFKALVRKSTSSNLVAVTILFYFFFRSEIHFLLQKWKNRQFILSTFEAIVVKYLNFIELSKLFITVVSLFSNSSCNNGSRSSRHFSMNYLFLIEWMSELLLGELVV